MRQALELAIDRDALNQVVFNGEFVPGNQWVSPENPYYQKAFPVPKRDVAKAKALLKEAGVTAPFDVDFMVPKGAETQAVAEVIQAMAAEVGINMKIRVTEFATSLKQAEEGEYQAFCWPGAAASIRTATPTSSTSARRRKTTGPGPTRRSTSGSTTPACQRQARKAIYEKVTKAILTDVPKVYLYHRRILIAHTAKLEGYKQMPDGLVRVVGLHFK